MRAEALRVQLRPRSGWEAADLGFMMAREWWRPLWGTWLAAYLPLALALTWAFRSDPMYAALILWWLKPAFDRVALHVLSRAVFGESTTVKSTLRDRNLLRPGLLYALTLGRFSLARSFLLPVAQLEQLTGRDARLRRSALSRSRARLRRRPHRGVCEFRVHRHDRTGRLLAGMLTPAAGAIAPDLASWFSGGGDDRTFWSLYDGLAYVVAVCFVEPLYVAGGFAVYLNRRTLLEGWDIEVALRRLADRLTANARRAAVVLLACTVAFTAAMPGDAVAADDAPPAAEAVSAETPPRTEPAAPADAAARAQSAPQCGDP